MAWLDHYYTEEQNLDNLDRRKLPYDSFMDGTSSSDQLKIRYCVVFLQLLSYKPGGNKLLCTHKTT